MRSTQRATTRPWLPPITGGLPRLRRSALPYRRRGSTYGIGQGCSSSSSATHSARVLPPDGRVGLPSDTRVRRPSSETRTGPGPVSKYKITSLDVLPAVVGNKPGPADACCVRDYEDVIGSLLTHQLAGFLFGHDTNTMSWAKNGRPTRRTGQVGAERRPTGCPTVAPSPVLQPCYRRTN